VTREHLVDLLLELADLVRVALRSPTIRLMLPARVREIIRELEDGITTRTD
jgi:hypothetical protein